MAEPSVGEVLARIQGQIDTSLASTSGVSWSVCIRDGEGKVIASHDSQSSLSTASVGKLLLLTEVARQIEAGLMRGSDILRRTEQLAVADSGIWQFLRNDKLAIDDLAVLVGCTSDNLATNVLLERVGLAAVASLTSSLGIYSTALQDRVRDERGVDDPMELSVGCAEELSDLLGKLSRGHLISPNVSDQLDRWLAVGVDLSMVAAPFNLDPLAHVNADRNITLRNKTGTDDGVRADVGYILGPKAGLSYAVIANWNPADGDCRDTVLCAMRRIGSALSDSIGSEFRQPDW